MLPQSNLRFLQDKILDLKNALFISQNCSLLKMATTVVSVSKVDDMGQMWFFLTRPQQALHEFDREFPVRLEFFKKGKQFFLHVCGRAFIVDDPEEINSLVHEDIREQAGEHLVLIRVKMLKADYFESTSPATHARWWRELRNQLHTWMFNTRRGYKPYHLAETPMPVLSYQLSSFLVICTVIFCLSCNNGSSSDSSAAAKDSNAAKIDSTAHDTTAATATIPATVSKTDADFVVNTANAGMTEIKAGSIAESTAMGKDVKKYGEMMVRDHTAAADKLKEIADTKHITLPTDLSADSQQAIADLSKKNGKDFDKAYLSMMVSDHKKVISAFEDEAKNGSDADIRAFADSTLHTLKIHLDAAEKCEKMEKAM
jgi:putative membrane protein